MAINSYIDLGNSGTLQRKDLDTQVGGAVTSAVTPAVSSALSALVASGFTDLSVDNELMLKNNTLQGYLKVATINGVTSLFGSTDHTNWTPILNESQQQTTGLSYEWSSSTTYAADEIVISNGLWYIATAASTNQTPAPGSSYWRVLSAGNRKVIVTTLGQLVSALGTASSIPLHIVISGELTDGGGSTVTTVTVNNSSVVIESYENDSLTAYGLSFVAGTGLSPVIYWHSHGMKLGTVSLSTTGCKLYIADVNLTRNAATTLSGDIIYQRSTGIGYFSISGSGPAFDAWETATAEGEFVPLALNTLNQIPLDSPLVVASRLYLYAKDPEARQGGYLTLADITSETAKKAARTWKIDSQGLTAAIPASNMVEEGYLYLATDTGMLYRKGESTWEGPYQFTGPAGSSGGSGSDGVSPAVTISSFTSAGRTGKEVIITDASHPSGQSFKIYDGQSGSTTIPTMTASASALSAGAPPTVSITSTAGGYNMSLGIPVGAMPTLTCSATAIAAGSAPTVSASSTGATSYRLNFGIPAVTSITDILEASLPLVLSGGTMVLNKSAAEFAHSHPMAAVSGLTALSSSVATISTAVSSKVDSSDVHNATITIRQSGRSDQTFSLNQSASATIELDGGVSNVSSLITSDKLEDAIKPVDRENSSLVSASLYSSVSGSTGKLIFVDSLSSEVTHHKVETSDSSLPLVESVTDSGTVSKTKSAFYIDPGTTITLTNGLSSQSFSTPVWGERRTVNLWLYQIAAVTTSTTNYPDILSYSGPYDSTAGHVYTWALKPTGDKWVLTDSSHSVELDNIAGAWHMITLVETAGKIECYKDGAFAGAIEKPASGTYILYQRKFGGSYTGNTQPQVYISTYQEWQYCMTPAQIRRLYSGTVEQEVVQDHVICYCENGELTLKNGMIVYASQPTVWNGTAFAATKLSMSQASYLDEGITDVFVKTTAANLQYQASSDLSAVTMTTSAGDIVHLRVFNLGNGNIYVKSEVL